jgi:succinate dehydrogenase/fumarate reductase cytochrome b subunit
MIKVNSYLNKEKKSKIYSPYLSIYKPQFGNIISILERITGIFIVLSFGIIIIISYLKNSLLLNYSFYLLYYIILKSGINSLFINSLIIFLIFNFLFHISFIPILFKRYNGLFGNVNNYNIINFKEIIIKSSFSISILIISTVLVYIIIM